MRPFKEIKSLIDGIFKNKSSYITDQKEFELKRDDLQQEICRWTFSSKPNISFLKNNPESIVDKILAKSNLVIYLDKETIEITLNEVKFPKMDYNTFIVTGVGYNLIDRILYHLIDKVLE